MRMSLFRVPLALLVICGPCSAQHQDSVPLPQLRGSWTPLTMAPSGNAATVHQINPGFSVQSGPGHREGYSSLYHCPEGKPLNFGDSRSNLRALHGLIHLPVGNALLVGDAKQGWNLAGRDSKTGQWKQIALQWLPRQPMPPIQCGDAPLRVAVFDDYGSFGKGVPVCVERLQQRQPGVEVRQLRADEIAAGALRQFHIVVFSGGSGGKQASTLGMIGRQEVREFVRQGGGYLGICAGNYLACRGFAWGLGILDAKTKSSRWARGTGDLLIEAVGEGPALLGLPAEVTTIRYANGPVFAPAGDTEIPDFTTLAVFRSEFAKNGAPKGAQIGSPAMVSGQFGRGRVLCSSPHPEQQPGMEDWLFRAVSWLGRRQPDP